MAALMTPAAELRAKVRAERRLAARVRALFGAVGRSIERGLGPTGGSAVPSIVEPWEPVLAQLLLEHYGAVARAFGWKLSQTLPPSLRPSPREREVIAIEMGRVFRARSEAQATLILQTAERRVVRSIGRVASAIAEPGSGLTARDTARLVARDWTRRQVVQARAVGQVETQTAAETAKAIEAHRLLGARPPVEKALVGEAFKLWVTQGDSRVRTGSYDHLDADGQRVPVSQPFDVSGERLMWPGDWSLGASGGNIYGCRCSSVYEVDSVAELRDGFLEQILADLETFTQTESDVVVSRAFAL